MKPIGKRGMFGRLLRKKDKPEDQEAVQHPVAQKPKAEEKAPESSMPQAAASGQATAPKVSSSSLVELEIDMTEEEISTIAISLDDIEKELAEEELETLTSEEFATAGIAPTAAELRTSAGRAKMAIEIPPEERDVPVEAGSGSAIPLPHLDATLVVPDDDEDDVELDTTDEEEGVELEEPVRTEEAKATVEERTAPLPGKTEEPTEVTARDAAIQYGFPEFVPSSETAAQAAQPSPAAVDHSAPSEEIKPGGIGDVALGETGAVEDLLGVEGQAAALAEFVRSCRTPFWVAIQGEAGSGKTSFMRLVEAKLDQSSISVRFNPLNFQRSGSPNHLVALLLRGLVRNVSYGVPQDDEERIRKMAEEAVDSMNAVFGTTLSVDDANLNPAEQTDFVLEPGTSGASSKPVNNVRDQFKAIFDQSLDLKKKARIIVFLDDLDRLEPSSAVQFLEETRALLSVEGCALVASCAFETIKRALDAGGRTGDGDTAARALFQRLFQLSVNVPTPDCDAERLLFHILQGTAFELSHEVLKECGPLVRKSLGSNPRQIKRLANNLIFASNLRPDAASGTDVNADAVGLRQKTLFGVGCLALAFEQVFMLALERLGDDGSLLSLFRDHLSDVEGVRELDRQHAIFQGVADKEKTAERLLDFTDCLLHVLSGGKRHSELDMERLNLLRQMIRLVSHTAVPGMVPGEVDAKRSGLTSFSMKVRNRLDRIMQDSPPDSADTFLRNWPSPNPWFGLWYRSDATKKAWGPSGLYYELGFETDGSVKLNISLKLQIEKVLQAGIPRETIDGLRNLPLVKDKRFQYRALEGNWVEIYREFGQVRCNTIYEIEFDEIDKAASDLKALVQATSGMFDTVRSEPKEVCEKPRAAQSGPPACKVCGTPLERMTLKDGSTGYRCTPCAKIYKPKGAGSAH